MWRLAIVLAFGGVVFAASATHTERLDLPSTGALRLLNSSGEVTVEGWDQDAVEITTLESADTDKLLQGVHIMSERKGDEVVVTTVAPKRHAHLEYRIKAPRGVRVTVEHNSGEVHIAGIAGDVHVIGHKGQITVLLPDGSYAIDAQSKLGAIDSDFPGDERKQHKFGHALLSAGSSPTQKLYLRMGFGDITILKMRKPETR